MEAAEQFDVILNDSGFLGPLSASRGRDPQVTADCPGLLEQYFSSPLGRRLLFRTSSSEGGVLPMNLAGVPAHFSDMEDLPGRACGTDTVTIFDRSFGLRLVRGPR